LGSSADWVRNLRKTPRVGLRIGTQAATATARVIRAGTKEDEFALIVRRGDDNTLILNDILSNVRHPKGQGAQVMARLLGFGHTTDYLPLDKKDAPTFSIARKAAQNAFSMANLKPRDMHGAEVHDCFSITEIVAYEILGLAEPGKGAELAKSGATSLPQVRNEKSGKLPFEIPVNTGGGLIADGHPVGATGVRQVFEAYQQLTEQAGARQIENAKRFLTFNMGGSLTTSVAMLWGRG
jgi:acetyl-CoA acetyltransferase